MRAVHDRPIVLKRYVDGITGEGFFQKRAPAKRPEWVPTVELRFPSGRTAHELVVTEPAQLAWMTNLGNIDLNPHAVRTTAMEHPDELRIDLDPCPGVPWEDVRRVAAVTREVLEENRLVGWPKTSGSRGMHVYARIEPRWGFTEVRRAALAVSREVERRAPGLGHQQVVEGGTGRRVPGLQPERQGPDHRRRLLGAAQPAGDGVRPPHLGRGARVRPGRLHAAHHAGAAARGRRPRGRHGRPSRDRWSRCWRSPRATRPRGWAATRRGRRTSPGSGASRGA